MKICYYCNSNINIIDLLLIYITNVDIHVNQIEANSLD